MKRILAQANKEWVQLRRDRLVMVLGALLPIGLLLLFSLGLSLKLTDVPLLVEDNDNTPMSRAYIETYGASRQFTIIPKPAQLTVEQALDAGIARGALILPVGFQRDASRGLVVAVQLLVDGSDANTAVIMKNSARGLNSAFLQRRTGAAASLPVRLQPRLWYNPGLSNPLYFGSGALGLVLILFPALLGALAAAREHELGTIVQAYASGLSAPQWIIGKAIPYVLLGLVQLVICFAIGLRYFGYTIPEDPTPMLVGSVLYLFAGVFYGMLLGNATGTQSAAIQGVQLGAFLISMLLSGFIFPLANIPDAIRWISWILPARHYVDLTRHSILRGAGWDMGLEPVLWLGGLMVFFFLANFKRLKRMQFAD